MSERVPAWKRLGLKLKYAKEERDSAEIPLLQGSKQKRAGASQFPTNDSHDTERPAKRRRTTSDESGNTTDPQRHVNGQNDHGSSRKPGQKLKSNAAFASDLQQPAVTKEDSHTSKKRKSVSFRDDTKIEDGDSRVTIDFPAGSPGSTPKKGKYHEIDDTEMDQPGSPASSNNIVHKKPKAKQKTAKKQKGQKLDPNKKPVAALEYLKQHRSNRDQWKFNKTRDIWILNHARDTDAIPRSYDLALAGYVHGLPAKAASRNRLISECREAFYKLEQEYVSHAEAKKYKETFLHQIGEEALTSNVEGGFLEWLGNQPRPRLILWALGAQEEPNQTVKHTVEAKEEKPLTPAERKRLKKSRTAAPIDVSSSSESESDSDSSDSSSDINSGRSGMKKAATNGITNGNDDTSSSGTSSSSEADDTSSSDRSASESSNDSD